MAQKVTYLEFEQRFKDLEAAAHELKRAKEALQESEQRYRTIIEIAPDVIFEISAGDGTITSLNPAFQKLTGWSDTEWLGKRFTSIIHIDDLTIAKQKFEQVLKGEITSPFELRVSSKSGEELVGEFIGAPQIKNGKVMAIIGFARDITGRKRAEQALEAKSQGLQEANTALKALLKRRDADKIVLEKKMWMNVKLLVQPLLEKMRKQVIDEKLKDDIDILASNLNEILSPFSRNLVLVYSNLTPTELQVADLIRQGKSSKEIAEMLNKSQRTIESHRSHIRSKLGIRNEKTNLRSHLLSFN
jgi:PAS domain S-box-containing protein